MVASPYAAPTALAGEGHDLIAAANALFGALELIGETPCEAETRREVVAATRAVHAHVAQAGLSREDLLHPRVRTARVQRPPGAVIPLGPRRSKQPG
jgi:type VI protein secretion system component VasF